MQTRAFNDHVRQLVFLGQARKDHVVCTRNGVRCMHGMGMGMGMGARGGGGEARVLDRFWMSRGVYETTHRAQLSSLVLQDNAGQVTNGAANCVPVPGLDAANVVPLQQRVLGLYRLLGQRDDVDVVWMVSKEPELLSVGFERITNRLVELRTSPCAQGLDVVKLVERQPRLLVAEGNIAASAGEEDVEQTRMAWESGLLGDGDAEWESRLEQLRQYREEWGDVHVGFRDGEDAELVVWATKQRRERRYGRQSREVSSSESALSEQSSRDRRWKVLEELGFEFDVEQAEWLRWFNELCLYQQMSGESNPVPLSGSSSFLLFNWCTVQRIAKRSGVLAADREELLNSLGFDWSGADALS